MYIQSKLKELEKSLFSLELSEEKENRIKKLLIQKSTDHCFKAECKIQYARDFFTIDAHFQNKQKLTDVFTVKEAYIQISYLGKGNSTLISSEDKKAIGLGEIQCCYNCDTVSAIEMPADSITHYRAIFISKEYYLKLLQNEAWTENNAFYKKVDRGNLMPMGVCKIPINYKLYHILNQITQADSEVDFAKYFIDLRLRELFLCLHIAELELAKTSNNGVSSDNIKKVEAAHAFLIENFKNPPTIKVLSRQVLLNELQLKKDFKLLYGKTIRNFIIDLRMEKAQTLLGKHTVGEMATILGYKSVPHFINTFKKHYGFTPKQVLRQ